MSQPPSGGCVLKLGSRQQRSHRRTQPPSGGCVLKQNKNLSVSAPTPQPPSGGCVLKLVGIDGKPSDALSAAFRRLCVETVWATRR
ncbi:hypothetical protein NEIPOLOT_02024 [Neisseria polysaccharea ATCC 43768]|nr:hypothetical protein NEIPOLOT_02024 [Neisseria polysaccharea ATCC 43768]